MRKLMMISAVLLLSGCNFMQGDKIPVNAPETLTAKAAVYNAENALVGEIMFKETGKGVELTAILNSLPPGVHGIHLHEVGKCDAPSFESAGAHFNPTEKKHGVENPLGPHVGDLPNMVADETGEVKLNLITADFTLKKGEATSIFDKDGTAVVIHEKEDDYKTDPAGNSGARIACGVVE